MDQRADTRSRNAKLETARKCKECGDSKPITEFNLASKGEGYRRHECKFCESSRKKAWYQADYDGARQRQNEAARRRYAKERKHSPERRKKLAEYATRCRAKAKQECFEHYGGMICACCGETEPMFLSLDHVNNDGYLRRKYGKATPSGSFYGFLRKTGYPDGFQVLCMNCNFGKARNGGVCPHHKEGSTIITKVSRAKRP